MLPPAIENCIPSRPLSPFNARVGIFWRNIIVSLRGSNYSCEPLDCASFVVTLFSRRSRCDSTSCFRAYCTMAAAIDSDNDLRSSDFVVAYDATHTSHTYIASNQFQNGLIERTSTLSTWARCMQDYMHDWAQSFGSSLWQWLFTFSQPHFLTRCPRHPAPTPYRRDSGHVVLPHLWVSSLFPCFSSKSPEDCPLS
jgi:hypothetical protein